MSENREVIRELTREQLLQVLADNLKDFNDNRRTLAYIVPRMRALLATISNGRYLKPLLSLNNRDKVIAYGYNVYLAMIGLKSGVKIKNVGSPMTDNSPAVSISWADLEHISQLPLVD